MKILCIYFEQCGPQRNLCLNLDSDWTFTFDGEEIQFEFIRRLPTDFWRVDGKSSSVDSVSAIVGRNGGGKTSIASTLSQTIKIWRDAGNGYCIDGGAGKCFVVVCDQNEIRLFRNFTVCFSSASKESLPMSHGYTFRARDFEEPAKPADFESPEQAIEVLYYSPCFSCERQLTASGGLLKYGVDASVTARLCKRVEAAQATESDDGRRADGLLRRYQDDDRKLAVRFIRECRTQHEETFRRMGIIPPEFVHYTFNFTADSGIGAAFRRAASKDKKYEVLENLLCAANVGVQLLLAFTGFCFGWYSFLPGDNDFQSDEVLRQIDSRLLGILKKIYCEEDVVLKEPKSNSELVARVNRRIKGAMDELKRLAEQMPTLLQGDSSPDMEIIKNVFDKDQYVKGLDRIWEFLKDGENDYCLFSKGSKCVNLARIDKERLENVLSLVDSVSGLYPESENGFLRVAFDPPISSGEMAYIMSFARIEEAIKESVKNGKAILLILDEVETTLHPAWQRKLVVNYLRYFSKVLKSHRVHILFLTHSPNLLSDIPDGNIMLLERNASTGKSSAVRASENGFKTFGANVYDLYRHSFFLEEGPVGEFAREKTRRMLMTVSGEVGEEGSDKMKMTKEDVRQLVPIVGDPALKRYFEVLEETGIL